MSFRLIYINYKKNSMKKPSTLKEKDAAFKIEKASFIADLNVTGFKKETIEELLNLTTEYGVGAVGETIHLVDVGSEVIKESKNPVIKKLSSQVLNAGCSYVTFEYVR